MEQLTQILYGGKRSALENNPVESFPVKADKKLLSEILRYVEKDSTSCPNCSKVAGSHNEIICDFGLRNMGNGTIRVQSWCKECRKPIKGVIA